ncbi:hypothetical protein D3C85_14640 [compost metagenome]
MDTQKKGKTPIRKIRTSGSLDIYMPRNRRRWSYLRVRASSELITIKPLWHDDYLSQLGWKRPGTDQCCFLTN